MSQYAAGRRVEYRVIHDLTDHGYTCTRAASSKGAADVIAIKEGQVLLVSVKRTVWPSPAERNALVDLALKLPGVAVPIVALGTPQLAYFIAHRGTVRVPWTADEAAA